MRESRSSGSVEGVASNDHPYSDFREEFPARRNLAATNVS